MTQDELSDLWVRLSSGEKVGWWNYGSNGNTNWLALLEHPYDSWSRNKGEKAWVKNPNSNQ